MRQAYEEQGLSTISEPAPTARTLLVGSSAHQTFLTGHNTRRIIQFSDTSGGFLNITNLTLTEGVASDDVGGAIHALGHTDTVHLFNSCITLCSAKKGASIYTNGYVTARNSLFASNFASMAGAAIALGGDHFEEDVATIENCTFSENGNDDPLGICIWFDFQPNPSAQGHASIDGCTFYRNLSNSQTYATVISPNYEWLISVSNSLLVDNGFSLSGTSHGLFRFPNAGSGGSLADNFQNLGGVYNTRSTGVANDLIIETTLANNGGPTPTHALVSGSPAIDAGINSLIPNDTLDQDKDNNFSEAIPFDQRGFGFPRIIDGTVDIGAFEFKVIISGDFNGDETVDTLDIELLAAAVAGDSTDLDFDLNSDDLVDFDDYQQFLLDHEASFPYEGWIAQDYSTVDPAVIGLNADANSDGVSNLMAFIWGRDLANPERKLSATKIGDDFVITYPLNDNARSFVEDSNIIITYSSDLANWFIAEPSEDNDIVQIEEDDEVAIGIDQIIIKIPVDGNTKKMFCRFE